MANSGLTVVVDQRGTYIIKVQDGPQKDRDFLASEGVQPQVVGVSERELDTGAEKTKFDEIVTIGSRRRGRTVTESMVPIDVFQLDGFSSTGYADMNDAFRTLVPAFNAKRLPLNDGSSLVRPVTLRGSPSDHILLLLNGKRRHRSATVHIATGHASTSGAQGQDFNVIPPIAMKRVEILRDGAAALYGSDAIAGVVNMTLRDSRDYSVASAHIGKYYDGGGATKDLQVNLGLPLGAQGFASLSAQYTHQNPTRTGGVHQGAQALRNAGVPDVPTPAVNMGEPFYEALKTVLNAGLPLGNDLDAYLFGNYMVSDSAVRFFYRQPIDAGGFARHATYRPSVFQGTDGHPENFDLQTVYPGGYTPQFGGRQQDASMVGGVRRESTDGLSWDAYLRWGWNEIQYNIENTINASMGVQSPTSFAPGALAQREYEGGVELSYPLEIGLPIQRGIFSAGLSYRSEAYTIRPGDEASYRVGPLVDLPAGANGFQGYSPDIAGTFTAASYASFLSYDADISDRLSAAATGRFEHYEKFGDNFSYQLSSRYKLAEGLAVRGSLGTGFRAPASGQLYGTSQTSQSSVAGDFILDAVLVLDAETAKIFGAEPFKPETSFSMSAGVVAKLQTGTTLTLDFYQIDVDDRLTLIPEFDTTPEQRQQLAAIGYPNGEAVQQVRYYQNILDSRIKGFDLVVLHGWNWAGGDNTTASLSLNYNDMSLRTPRAEEVFTPEKRIEFEDGIPRWNGNLSVTHVQNRVTFMVRGTYYGSWKRRSVVEGKPFLSRSPAVLFDAQAAYRLDDGLELQIGARNIFNKKAPQREPEIIATGNNVDNHSVFGVSGGYYYAGLRYDF
ncbi:TonB-dependent receptor plug domain-containing protein [Kordiimonas sp.]|uniref:TonB-dependent receptor plug domain-containing protein n=1 Tax=Kordiimonas sp. TaxID=1970157 RepID=UPI003A949223